MVSQHNIPYPTCTYCVTSLEMYMAFRFNISMPGWLYDEDIVTSDICALTHGHSSLFKTYNKRLLS